ncbi:MAG: YitT family protein [Bacteroidales bacterium]
MPFLTKEKLFSKQWFFSYALIIIGTFILAAGFVLFITPYKIVPGGVYGVSIIIHYLTKGMFSFAPEGLPIGVVGLSMDIPLILLGIKILGPRFGMKTIMGSALTAFWMDFLTAFWGFKPLVENDALLSSIFGGVLLGFGLGLIFKSKATSGGSDIIAMIIAKRTRLPLGQLMIYVDSTIVLLGLFAFQDWHIPLYSWLVIFICGKVIDGALEGVGYHKTMLIISAKYEEIREKIIVDLERGATCITAKGMYEGDERKIIFTNVNRREMVMLQDFIRDVDPNAFITIIDAAEVLGDGFKPINN